MSKEQDRMLEELLDSRPQDRALSLESLDSRDRTEIESLLEVADLLRERAHGAPPLNVDPVAAMLGLVPDSSRTLDDRALTRVMRATDLKPSELARRLSARGWGIEPRDVFNWQKSTAEIPPALIEAIAEVTGTAVEQLTDDAGPSPFANAIQEVMSDPRFTQLVRRWAEARRTTADFAESALAARVTAAVHRGAQPDMDQMLASLNALVSALEVEQGHGDAP